MVVVGPTNKNEFENEFKESVVGALSEVRELPVTGPALSNTKHVATPGGSEDLRTIGTARKVSSSIDGMVEKKTDAMLPQDGRGGNRTTEADPKEGKGPATAEEDTESVVADPSLISDALQSSQAGIIGEDLNRYITSWNGGAESIYGYSSEEVLGKSIHILVPPGRREDVPALIKKITNGELVEPFETVRLARGNRKVYVLLSISPVKNRAGKIIGNLTVSHDITAWRNARDERLHLAAIVESSSDAILSLNLDGIVTSWNPGAEKMFGYRSREIVGRSVEVLYLDGNLHEFLQMIARVKLGQHIDSFEAQERGKTGPQ